MNNHHRPFALDRDQIGDVLDKCRRIAVYGLREEPGSRSYEIVRFLSIEGFDIVPIGAFRGRVLRLKSYLKLALVPGSVDLIAVFPGGDVEQALADALRWKVPVVWFQRGVKGDLWAESLAKAGVKVVLNRCLRAEYLMRWPPVASLYSDVGAAD